MHTVHAEYLCLQWHMPPAFCAQSAAPVAFVPRGSLLTCAHASLCCAVLWLQADKGAYCGTEVMLTAESGYATKVSEDWYRVNIPLSAFGCDQGSAGGLAGIDRVDLQNINTRDADICLDNIALK